MMNGLPPTGMRAASYQQQQQQQIKPRNNPQSLQQGTNAAVAPTENEALKTLQHYVQQLLLVPLPSTSSTADSNSNSSSSPPTVPLDATPEALSYVYRIWVQLMQSPSPAVLLSRIHSLYSLSLVRYLLRGTSGGHPLSFLFVRLLALLAREPACARDMLADEEAAANNTNNSAVDNVTLISLVTGLLRTSDAPLMTTELIQLIQEMSEAFDASRINFIYEHQLPPSPSPSSPISSTEQQLSRLMRADARAQFIAAFLGNSSRSILLLLKHVSSPALNEHTRESLLHCIYACAFPSSASSSVVESGSSSRRGSGNDGGGVHATSIATRMQLQQRQQQARTLLLQQAAKWNETVLPSLQRFSNEDRVVHEENQAARIKQLRLIAHLRIALRLVKGPPQSNANASHNKSASGPYRPSATMMATVPGQSYAPPPIGFVAHGGRMPHGMMGATPMQPQQPPHRPIMAFGNQMYPSFRG